MITSDEQIPNCCNAALQDKNAAIHFRHSAYFALPNDNYLQEDILVKEELRKDNSKIAIPEAKKNSMNAESNEEAMPAI